MRVLHLLNSGGIGGIEVLCKDIGEYATWDNYFVFLFAGGTITEEMDNADMNVYRVYKGGKISLNKLSSLYKLIKDENVDVIVAHHRDIYLELYYILLKKFFPKKKFVMMLHNCYEEKYIKEKGAVKYYLMKTFIKKTISSSDVIIAVSKAGKESFERNFNIPDNKLMVIYNGIRNSLIDIGKDNEISFTGKIKIVYIGRLINIKGIDILIDAINQLKNRYKFEVMIIGDGTNKRDYVEKVNKEQLNEYIKFYGFQRDISKYLSKANIFVYPSICQEVFGISIIEAMAFGLPCIANRVGGIQEIIEDGVNGFLTDEISFTGIVKCLERFIESIENNRIQKISDNARKTSKKFSINNTITEMNKAFKSILDSVK